MPFALAVGWLVFRAKESGTSHFSARSWKEISVCRVLFIFRGGSPCPQPWPLSLSLWYCGTWRSSDPMCLFQLFLQGSSPSQKMLTAYTCVSSLVLEREQICSLLHWSIFAVCYEQFAQEDLTLGGRQWLLSLPVPPAHAALTNYCCSDLPVTFPSESWLTKQAFPLPQVCVIIYL